MLKVFLVGPDWSAWTTRSLERAFIANGGTVTRFDCHWRAERAGWRRVERLIWRLLPDANMPYYRWRNHRELPARVPADCDLVFVVIGDWLRAETVHELKSRTRARLALWVMDDPFIRWDDPPVLRTQQLRALADYDAVFVFDSYHLASLNGHFGGKFHHLPLAYDETVYRPLDLAKRYPVSFVGARYPNRHRLLRAIEDVGCEVWGGPFPGIRNLRHHPPAPAPVANEIYNQTVVNVNLNHEQSIWGTNLRTFEVPGSGGFLLTDLKRELPDLLVPGKEVETYASDGEFREKVRYYLDHPDEAARIAAAGHRRAAAEHTYACRIKTVLTTLNLD